MKKSNLVVENQEMNVSIKTMKTKKSNRKK